jgi:hypothetical protein
MNTSRGTRATTEPELGVGAVIGRYRLIGLIAEGPSGPLYVAERHGEEQAGGRHDGSARRARTVAVRCIRPELAQRPGFREQLADMARLVARCEHPNVARVLEIGEDQGRYFVSLEPLQGVSLAVILASSEGAAGVPPDIAAHLVKRVASAVLHARAVARASSLPVAGLGVELDPSDVFVTHAGSVQWLGIASPAALETTANAAADALGRLLWTLIPSTRTDVPEPLAAIAARAVAADPRARHPHLEALSQALDRYFFGQESRPTAAHVRRWLEGPCRPRPRPLWATSSAPSTGPKRQWLAGVVVAGALATGTALVPLSRAPRPAARPEARVEVRSTPSDAAIFVDGEPTGLRTPVVLQGLPADRPLQVGVMKAGFAPQQRPVALATGAVQTLVYELVASDGLVTFAGAPRGARFFVDGEELTVRSQQPVPLAVGPHALRVEAAGALVFSDRVLVVPGAQTLRVGEGRAAR